MKMRWGCLSLAILLLAVACRGETPEPGPDVLATERPTVVLAAGTPTLLAGTASSTATSSPLPTTSNPPVHTQTAEPLEDERLEPGPAVPLPMDTPTPTPSTTPTAPPPAFASMPTLLSAPWRAPASSAPLRQAVFLEDGNSQYRYLPSPGDQNLVPFRLSNNCAYGGVGFANFANLIVCASGLEGGEDQALVTDMFGKQVYHTLGPEVGWHWSPDDLHLIAEPDEERGRKGAIYHLLTGKLEDWPYTCDRVALSPRSGRLATW